MNGELLFYKKDVVVDNDVVVVTNVNAVILEYRDEVNADFTLTQFKNDTDVVIVSSDIRLDDLRVLYLQFLHRENKYGEMSYLQRYRDIAYELGRTVFKTSYHD